MIALKHRNEFQRVWKAETSTELVLHPHYGWIEKDLIPERDQMRAKQGFPVLNSVETLPSLHIDHQKKIISGNSSQILEIIQSSELSHKVMLGQQEYIFEWQDRTQFQKNFIDEKEETNKKAQLTVILIVLFFLSGLFYTLFKENKNSDLKQEEVLPQEPEIIKVQPIQEPKINEVKVTEQKNQALDPTVKAQKALTQNLGFLKMLGRKDLKKAVGGLPTLTQNASAGAGPGGDKGSGGEMLNGVGEGLRKTTVGNTGTKGLGGIGTEGAGGGLGGYGDSLISSGAGRALSTVPLARQATVEGGLDRALIQATILRYLSQIRACYEEGLKQKPDLIGQISTDFEINAQGSLNFVKISKSSLNDRFVEDCVVEKMKSWKFPTPRGGVSVKVSYPFMLRPVGK
jgi:hypothetical protein